MFSPSRCTMLAPLFLIITCVGLGQSQVPLSRVLRPDGTLDRTLVTTGTMDARGYTMVTDADGTPRFLKDSELKFSAAGPNDIFWSDRFAQTGVYSNPASGGEGGSVVSVSPSGHLWVGGYFSMAGNTPARGIARYANGQFESLGDGFSVSSLIRPTSVEYFNSDIIVGGISSIMMEGSPLPVGGVARWNGTGWASLGGGVSGASAQVHALAVKGGTLYVGGSFTQVGSVPANNIARWNGSTWDSLGAGANNTVFAIALSGDTVYIGGQFTQAGGRPASRVARWFGGAWDSLGAGTNGTVRTLAVHGVNVYAGGGFSAAGGATAQRIARWTSSGGWSALGSGLTGGYPDDNSVRSIVVNPRTGELYAAGDFTASGATSLRYVAKWSGSVWSAVGEGFNREPYSLALDSSDHLYATGNMSTSGSLQVNTLAKFDGVRWTAVSTAKTNGLNGIVRALAEGNGSVYAGGSFTTAGPIVARGIGRWNGSQWDSLKSGIGTTAGTVYAIAVYGTNVYMAGTFTNAGGNADADYVAMWDGSNWSPLGRGLNDYARAIYVAGPSEIYVGGRFTSGVNTDGSSTGVNRVARWDGSRWDSLGSGTNVGVSGAGTPEVYTLELIGDSLYVGGNFTTVANTSVPATYVAKWVRTTNQWSALGSGVSGTVLALKASGSQLYVGGNFLTAGGNSFKNLAVWDGASWSGPWGSDINGTVHAIALSGNHVYVGGQFGNIGAPLVGYIARWNGASWAKLGSGLDYYCNALAIVGDTLYAAGSFAQAGAMQASFFSTWKIQMTPPAAPTLASPANGASVTDTSVMLTWSGVTGAGTYELQVDTSVSFAAPLISEPALTSTNYQAIGLSKGKTYRWRVRGANTEGAGSFSTVFSFTTPPAAPSVPALAVPTDAVTGQPLNVVLRWFRVASATSYRVQVSVSAGFSTTVIDDSTLTDTMKTMSGLSTNSTYFWRVMAKNAGGTSAYSPARSFTTGTQTGAEGDGLVPAVFDLQPAYPNPFNPSTTFRFTLAANGPVSLVVYDVLGREVARLIEAEMDPGVVHQATFDAAFLPSGVYFAVLRSGHERMLRRVVLMK